MQLNRDSGPINQIGFLFLFFEELVHIIIMNDDELHAYVISDIAGIEEGVPNELYAINKILTTFFKTEDGDISKQTKLRNILILDKLSTIYKEAKKQFFKLKIATQLQELREAIRRSDEQQAERAALEQQLSTLKRQSLFYTRYCLLNAIITFNRHPEKYYNLPFDQLLIYHMFCLLLLLFDINLESYDDAVNNILSGNRYNTIQEINDLIRDKGLSITLNKDFTNLDTARYAIDIGLDTALPLTCEQMYYEVDSCELIFRDDPEPVPVQINENSYDIAQYFEILFNVMKKETPLDESSVLLLYHNRNTEDD